MKYIDAERLRAEVNEIQESGCASPISVCNDILSFIDYLQQEQPEVDLEKEIEDYAYSLPHSSTGSSAYVSDKRLPIARQFGIKHDWSFDYVEDIARHFYELGLKARKEDGSHE